ncbi:DNA-binding CsgD family transcriptional regulator [Arthrobacter sp. B2I5]|uniref:helix-turn-helix transcriptional regulator n=1 Tax=Arthrobacter sp. B2I5 TaxID=3042266 RepID=UPI00277FBD3B|nr:helix-turn-helix transcriptional regulator [Arthrobacter sp. B2I5]MDQ0826224.1 DNA-binding CsgD family transcriptional regulator [Arthrobacter sp. B2I5]
MASNNALYRLWLEFLGEVLRQPLTMSRLYEPQLLELLAQSFNSAVASRNQVSPTWEDHILSCWPRDIIPNDPPGGYDFSQQPLLRWFVLTGRTGPQSYGRVPDELASDYQKGVWEELSRPWGINHQLSIPLRVGGGDHNAYLLSRPDRDFTEQELALAGLLQPILTGLSFQLDVAVLQRGTVPKGSPPDLTIREMTILTLLSQGLTAEALARRLAISPRTASKHLEHIYRKLDVRDRLMAVQNARLLGLLAPTPEFQTSRRTAY